MYILGFPEGSSGKESPCSAGATGDVNSVPGSGRAPGGGNGNPFQYSCLGSPMDRGAWWATIHRVTTEHIHETNNKDLLYNTGNSSLVLYSDLKEGNPKKRGYM